MNPLFVNPSRIFLIASLIVVLGACAYRDPRTAQLSPTAYYWQSMTGHLGVLQRARPVADWLAQDIGPETAAPHSENGKTTYPAAAQKLRSQLELSQRLRAFASSALHLPRNASYTRYADLQAPSVVWNVVAAPAWSLQAQPFCLLVVGCVEYKGFYRERDAQAEATQLRRSGLEVLVSPVPAYSTLGRLWWLGDWGADPLLSTFIAYPEPELARLMFHELAHQVVFVEGDSAFNESFATAVERIGVQRWLAHRADAALNAQAAALAERRQAFKALTAQTRAELQAVYQTPPLNEASPAKAAGKAQALDQLRSRYAVLRQTWLAQGLNVSTADQWLARVNNATFSGEHTYEALVPAFLARFDALGQDLPKFYEDVKRLAKLNRSEREAELGLPNSAKQNERNHK